MSKRTPHFFDKQLSNLDQEWDTAHGERLPQKTDVLAIVIGVTFATIVTFFPDEMHSVFSLVPANHIHRLAIIPAAAFLAIAIFKILKNQTGTGLLYMAAMAGCFATATLAMMR